MEWARAAPEPEAARDQEGRQAGRRPATVVTAPVVAATINDKLSAIGTGRANNSVTVNPYTSGRLTEIAVESGRARRGGHGASPGSIRRPRRSPSTAPGSRSTTPRPSSSASTSLRTSNTATAGAGDRRRTWRRQCAAGAARRASSRSNGASIIAPIAGIVGILPVEAGNYVTSRDGDRHDRRPLRASSIDFWVPERFAARDRGRRAADRDADRPAERGLRRHGQRRRQPARRARAARCCVQAAHRQRRRHAARRHVVPGRDAVSRRHLSVGRSAGHPVGHRRRLRLGGARRQGQAHAGAHRPAQHRERAGRRPTSAAATTW